MNQQESREVSLATLDLVIFEFLKVIEQEADRARGKRNLKRVKVLQSLRERFPRLLREFDVELKTGDDFSLRDLDEAYFFNFEWTRVWRFNDMDKNAKASFEDYPNR